MIFFVKIATLNCTKSNLHQIQIFSDIHKVQFSINIYFFYFFVLRHNTFSIAVNALLVIEIRVLLEPKIGVIPIRKCVSYKISFYNVNDKITYPCICVLTI